MRLVAVVSLCFASTPRLLADQLDSGVHYFNYLDPSRGAYQFGYDTGPKTPSQQSFREETRSEDGGVRGRYGYVESGVLRLTEYTADHLGYRCRETVRYLVKPGARRVRYSLRSARTGQEEDTGFGSRRRGDQHPPQLRDLMAQPARVMGKKVVGRYKDFTSEPAVGGTAAVARWDSAHGQAAELREEELPDLGQRLIGGTPVWLTARL